MFSEMAIFQIFVLVTFFYIAIVHATDCSPNNRGSNPQQCLSSIAARAKDDSAFWFGLDYSKRCPNPYTSPDCSNPSPNTQDSLITRVFGSSHALDVDYQDIYNCSQLTKYIDVTFTTGTGTYSGCGVVSEVSNSRTLTLDPTGTSIFQPWDLRKRPSMTWPAEDDELYTLFVYDAGNFINHGIFLNIPGNNIENSEIIKDYSGPRQATPTPNIYAFLLFLQTGRVDPSIEWQQKLNTSKMSDVYNMTDAVKYLNLTGPVALNWMRVTIDAYAIQTSINLRIMYTCPYLITEAISNHNRSFIPDGTSMTVDIDVTYSPSAITFMSCCASYIFPARSFSLKPLGDARVNAWDVRSDAVPSIDLTRLGFYTDMKNFTGRQYTLLCVDPDVPHHTKGTLDRPLLHWQVINIENGDVSQGETTMTHRGPQPPDVAHFYYFLLYEQTTKINPIITGGYTTPTNSRYLFNITDFVMDNHLTLVGTTWMIVEPDAYTRHLWVSSGRNESNVCSGIQGYDRPCPTSGSSALKPFSVLLFIVCNSVMRHVLHGLDSFAGLPDEDYHDWLNKFEDWVAFNGWSGDDDKIVSAMRLKLKGSALTWFQSLPHGVRSRATHVFEEFKEHFSNVHLVWILEQQLSERRMQEGESFEQYIEGIAKQCRRLDKEMTIVFIRGLPPHVKLFVVQQNPKDFRTAVQSARIAQQSLQMLSTPMMTAGATPNNRRTQESCNQTSKRLHHNFKRYMKPLK